MGLEKTKEPVFVVTSVIIDYLTEGFKITARSDCGFQTFAATDALDLLEIVERLLDGEVK